MSWVLLAGGSVFFFTALGLLQRVLAVDSQYPRAMAFLFNSAAFLIAVLIFFISGAQRNFSLPHNPQAWLVLAIGGLAYGVFDRGRFAVAKLLDASVMATVNNVSVLVAFVGSFFLYSETIGPTKIIGGLLVIIALLLVSLNRQTKKSSLRGILLGVFISTFLGLAWMLDKLGSRFFQPPTYNILIWLISTLFIYFPPIKTASLKIEIQRTSWKVVLMSTIIVIGYYMELKALQTAEATRVIPIVQTATLLTVLAGIVILKERDHLWRKILAGCLALLGASFLI